MGYLIRRDPYYGEVVEWQGPMPHYPPPAPRPMSGPPAYPEDYYPPPMQYPPPRPRRAYTPPRKYARKAVTWGLGVPWFVCSFALCEIHPACCLISLALLFGWALSRSFRD